MQIWHKRPNHIFPLSFENIPQVQHNLGFHTLYEEVQPPPFLSRNKHGQNTHSQREMDKKNRQYVYVCVYSKKDNHMLTFWRNALSPKSETFKFPKASRRRFSGYTEKKRKDLIRAGPIRKSTSQMLNCTICWLFTFRSLWYTPFR